MTCENVMAVTSRGQITDFDVDHQSRLEHLRFAGASSLFEEFHKIGTYSFRFLFVQPMATIFDNAEVNIVA